MALADALQGLLRLPGATYACVVERDGGRVLAEAGRGEGGAGDGEGVVPYSVAGWGTAVAAMFATTSGDELDDVMITGRRSYHLVRPLGPGAAVLVYLRLDRARANLAAARRELATVRWEGAPARGGPQRSRAVPETRTAVPETRTAVPKSRVNGAVPSSPPRPAAAARVPAALPPAGSSGAGGTRAPSGRRIRYGAGPVRVAAARGRGPHPAAAPRAHPAGGRRAPPGRTPGGG